MLTLPEGSKFTIRNPHKSIVALAKDDAAHFMDRGGPSRIKVVIARSVSIVLPSSSRRRVQMVRLADGWKFIPEKSVLAERVGARNSERVSRQYGVAGSIEPGIIVTETEGLLSTIYLYDLSGDPDTQGALDVARDAMLQGNDELGKRLALKALPRAYGLFIELTTRERRHLAGGLIDG